MRALISILLVTVAIPSQAATWRVQKDGSGDFTQIQEAIDPERARRLRESSLPEDEDVCTMCAEFCAIKKMREAGFVEKEETV